MIQSLTLRGVLETEAHYNERPTEDLCNTLTSLVQLSDDFV